MMATVSQKNQILMVWLCAECTEERKEEAKTAGWKI